MLSSAYILFSQLETTSLVTAEMGKEEIGLLSGTTYSCRSITYSIILKVVVIVSNTAS